MHKGRKREEQSTEKEKGHEFTFYITHTHKRFSCVHTDTFIYIIYVQNFTTHKHCTHSYIILNEMHDV